MTVQIQMLTFLKALLTLVLIISISLPNLILVKFNSQFLFTLKIID
jgi:hypothetical protein